MFLIPSSARGMRAAGHRCSGFTLVEVMVVAVVIIVGLAGLATLQVSGLRAVQSTFERSEATGLVYEMVDRLRANRGNLGEPTSALGGAYDDALLCQTGARHPNDDRDCNRDDVGDFVGASLATLDLLAWWQNLSASSLPHWYAGIRQDNRVFTVAVQWDDVRAAQDLADSNQTKTSCLGDAMPIQLQEVCMSSEL